MTHLWNLLSKSFRFRFLRLLARGLESEELRTFPFIAYLINVIVTPLSIPLFIILCLILHCPDKIYPLMVNNLMNKESGQTNAVIVIVGGIIAIIGLIIFGSRILAFTQGMLANTGEIAGLQNILTNPTDIPSATISATISPQATLGATITAPSPTSISATITGPTPVPTINTSTAINGLIKVFNFNDKPITEVTIYVCLEKMDPPGKQECSEIPFNRVDAKNNSVWTDYNSTGNYYYRFFLIKDSRGTPMEYGKSYIVAWAKAASKGQEYFSKEKWVSLPFPSNFNFNIYIPDN